MTAGTAYLLGLQPVMLQNAIHTDEAVVTSLFKRVIAVEGVSVNGQNIFQTTTVSNTSTAISAKIAPAALLRNRLIGNQHHQYQGDRSQKKRKAAPPLIQP